MARPNYKSNTRKSNSKSGQTGKYEKGKRTRSQTEQTESTDGSIKSVSPAIANIVNASASVAVRNVAGNLVKPGHTAFPAGITQSGGDYVVPGVVSVKYAPVFGKATGVMTDPVNLAARNMWMNLRSLYSNRIPYTAGSIVIYAMALDSVLTAFQWLKRAYGIIFAYDARNRYVPDALLLAMGINAVDFRANLPFIKVYLNKLATQLTAFGVPTDLRFILDHVDASAHIYMDDASANAQYIVTTPSFLWQVDWSNNTLNAVQWSATGTGGATWEGIQTLMNGLVENFVNNEDVYMIASDMLRLYGSLAMVTPVDSSFMVGPEYSSEFLEVMHNATYPMGESLIGCHIQSPAHSPLVVSELQSPDNVGAITVGYSTGFYYPNTASEAKLASAFMTPFDFDEGDPSTDQIVRASNWRYVIQFVSSLTDYWQVKIQSTGTLLIDSMSMIAINSGVFTDTPLNGSTYIQNTIPGSYDSTVGLFYGASCLAIWDRHPILPCAKITSSIASKIRSFTIQALFMPLGELDQYVLIDPDELERIHEAIILDKFDAAGVGTLNLRTK